MPASRNARAMTLAPRSWPSSPGLAINTRIFFVMRGAASRWSRYRDLFVGAEGVAHGVADFAECGVGFDGVIDEGHEVVLALARGSQSVESPQHFIARPLCAQFLQPRRLAMRNRFVDLQNIERFLF